MDSSLGPPWTADAAATAIWDGYLESSNGHDRLVNGDSRDSLRDTAYKQYLQLQLLYLGKQPWTQAQAAGLKLLPEIIQMLQDDRDRHAITTRILEHHDSETESLELDSCEGMLDFIARCLTLTKIGTLGNEANPRRYVQWQTGGLRGRLAAEFNGTPEQNCDHVRLCKDFDAWAVEAVGAISIKFTDNLADHLLLVEDDTAVLIFHHASFLECHGGGRYDYRPHSLRTTLTLQKKKKKSSSMLPTGLAQETLKTLALLFPQREYLKSGRASSHKRAWLRKHRQVYSRDYSGTVDERLTRCGNLTTSDRQIKQFLFWRDRLVVLKQAYDESTPRAMSQWWYDRRNGVQWYTFWVAVLVLFLTVAFGLVQCIEGALQVYKAYNP